MTNPILAIMSYIMTPTALQLHNDHQCTNQEKKILRSEHGNWIDSVLIVGYHYQHSVAYFARFSFTSIILKIRFMDLPLPFKVNPACNQKSV